MSLRRILAAAALGATAVALPATATAAYAASGTDGVQVVRPGQVVDTGHGVDLELTRSERCVGTPGDWNCKSVTDGNQAPDSVSLQTQGDASGTLYTPLYIGDGRAARMTVVSGGVTYDVQVVTLPGRPGYATGYVWGAPLTGQFPGDWPQVTVYDASGKVLATL